jgi:hypothetical protein
MKLEEAGGRDEGGLVGRRMRDKTEETIRKHSCHAVLGHSI